MHDLKNTLIKPEVDLFLSREVSLQSIIYKRCEKDLVNGAKELVHNK